jgi:hypothetical protein
MTPPNSEKAKQRSAWKANLARQPEHQWQGRGARRISSARALHRLTFLWNAITYGYDDQTSWALSRSRILEFLFRTQAN